ncbi:MBL fold metallo-hydrolase [Pedobacter sp. Leaf41]|uniref:MBL fold metallo-hydrolase n=1 Tax=Pedobacter sp. Leaf41 TaxID=1736218 RepID=UPI000702D700|nr:MBL fold metallo-hydrolase [Pedobacter sp. Leaf41]KQN34362.1 MBL fold metallo-hydrolase [Pedobacter sp. Leaf41]
MKHKVLKIFKWIFIILVSLILILSAVTYLYMKKPLFGKAAKGVRLERMKKSPHFKDGVFHNLNRTPELTEGYSTIGIIYDKLFGDHPRLTPVDSIPSTKVDLLHLPIDSNILVWFGHSSYFIQLDGKRILVDPVFSGNASPIPGTVVAFKGTDRYKVEDLPNIDYLIISHDHYDHTDYETLIKLKSKIKKVFCGLGVGADFEDWGYNVEDIYEKDWDETIDLGDGFFIHTTPTRHFSGRGFTRNNTLWMSYVFQSPTMKIYIGGDSGYDTHFANIGKKFGPIDLAILEDGQYDVKWKYIHLQPTEVLKAAQDLNAKRLFPVHSSKFVLANHPWDEPLVKITELNKVTKTPLVTPMIGEFVYLKKPNQIFKPWWIGIK